MCLMKPSHALGVDGRVFDRGVGEDQRRRIDPLLGVGRRIGDQVAIAVTIGLVEVAARAVLRDGGARVGRDKERCIRSASRPLF